MTTAVDPFDVATEAGERGSTYFGKIEVDAQFVALIKGRGKIAWDESMGEEQRRTEVSIHLNPIDAMNLTRPVERGIIAESREWTGIVWPSLRELGVKNAREIRGKFAKVELVKTGRTYQNREGATIENTTIKFHSIFDSERDCVAAYEAETGGTAGNGASANGSQAVSPPSDAEKAAAMNFLPALVKSANGDRAALAQLIAGMPIIARYFTVDSPEVQLLLQEG